MIGPDLYVIRPNLACGCPGEHATHMVSELHSTDRFWCSLHRRWVYSEMMGKLLGQEGPA